MRAAIIAHARREAPRECCGIIAGRDGAPVRVYPTTNIAEGNRFYEIDPKELADLEFRELPNENAEIVAIYHSHPASPAYPSRTDVELAFWPEAVYLICSLEDPDKPYIRGFTIRDGQIAEVTLPA
ncbi:MAG: M67 family metallopeptidase [Thermomicrobiales bacterium]|nr:M67 family metallopeptidase [Thermomicrobiales bacterium]